MTFSEETLMAYVDGELDAKARADVEAAMAADPEVAERVARHEALRLRVQAAFGAVLDEPVPEHLMSAARTAPTRGRENVTDLARERAARSQSQRPAIRGATEPLPPGPPCRFASRRSSGRRWSGRR